MGAKRRGGNSFLQPQEVATLCPNAKVRDSVSMIYMRKDLLGGEHPKYGKGASGCGRFKIDEPLSACVIKDIIHCVHRSYTYRWR